MSQALSTGRFNPFTNSHLNVLDHVSKIFNEVIVND
jgi:phosphopantetheine adenylyltransferase